MTLKRRSRSRRMQSAVLAAVLGLSAGHWGMPAAAAPQVTAYKLSLAEKVADDPAVARFYRQRDFAPVWTGDEGAERRAAFLAALAKAVDHGLPQARYDPQALISDFHSVQSGDARGALEARMSRVFVRYAQDITSGVLTPRNVGPNILREVERPAAADLLQELTRAETPARFLRDLVPERPEYARLFRTRQTLIAQLEAGGWGPHVRAEALRPGDTGDEVVALRNRLIRMGVLERSVSRSYDLTLQMAVRRFQERHGLEADGVAGRRTLEAINETPRERLIAVSAAMERERWLNRDLGARHIWVNLTDFAARIVDHGAITLQTRSVVGHRATNRQTPEFSEDMTYMEVNPDWTVPRSIIARDYLPGLQANRHAHPQMQVIDARGNVVDRSRVDFSQYSIRTFPFNLRQPPGPRNALGRVKFMFPNPHAIYLHDTPQRSLFDTLVRTHSSGCVRLEDPLEFAYELLGPQAEDPVARFHTVLATGRQTRIYLDDPVPVHLVYRTAFTDADGQIQYRPDIYGRDRAVFEALVDAGVVLPGVES